MRRLSLAQVEQARQTLGQSVLLFLTDRCPVGCAHCSVDSRQDSPTISDFELFEQIVEALCTRPDLRLVGISGGEPFVERRGLMLASRRLIEAEKDVVVYTSGVWATSSKTPEWIGQVLRSSSCVFLSTDAFHATAMAVDRFIRAALAIAAAGTWIVVQVIDLEDMVARAEDLLRQAFGDGYSAYAEFNLIPALPYGRGASVFQPRSAQTPGHAFGRCRAASAPVIRYDGRLTGCCNELVMMGGGPDRLRRRGASGVEVSSALDAFRADPLLAAIGSVGPGALTAHPRFEDLSQERFRNICAVCWRMFEKTAHDRQPDAVINAFQALAQTET